MPSYVPCKKNDANGLVFYVGFVSQANTKILQANPTLAAGDAKIAIDDGAPANLGTLPAVDADFTKRVKVVLSQAETNGDNLTIIFSDAAGAEWCDLLVNIQTVARQIDDLAFPTTSGRSLTIETDGMAHADVKEWLGVAPLALSSQKVQAVNSDVGTAGAGLTAIPWNAAWDAEVESEANDALVVHRLDELLNADSDIDGLAPPTVGSVFHELLTKTAASFTYDQATDSLEAIRDKETDIETDTAVIGAAGAGLTAVPWNAAWDAEVESEVDDALGLGTGTSLTAIPWNAAWDAEVQSEVADALDAAVPGVPTANSINERVKTMDDADLPGRTPAALVGGRTDASVGAVNGVAASAQNLEKSASIIYQGSVTGAATTTTLIDSGLTQADADFWKGRIVIFTSGANKYQATDITAFDPATDKLTFTALTAAPALADTYVIL